MKIALVKEATEIKHPNLKPSNYQNPLQLYKTLICYFYIIISWAFPEKKICCSPVEEFQGDRKSRRISGGVKSGKFLEILGGHCKIDWNSREINHN